MGLVVMEGQLQREGMYVFLQLLHVAWQKPTQHCRTLILQLTITFKKRNTDKNVQGNIGS